MNVIPEQIIWSADLPWDKIKMVIDSGALPKGTVIKLDRLFFVKNSIDIITYCQERGYPVFVDAKIVEIPSKTLAIVQYYLEAAKPWMINVMAGVCNNGVIDSKNPEKNDTLKQFAEMCAKAGTKSCVVTVLTSKTEDMCRVEFEKTPLDQVLKYVDLAVKCGVTDIVCSAREAEAIRQNPGYAGVQLNTPGIRLPDSSKNDQARVMTPAEALKVGANRLVIGRDLTRGMDEASNQEELIKIIQGNYQRIMDNISAA